MFSAGSKILTMVNVILYRRSFLKITIVCAAFLWVSILSASVSNEGSVRRHARASLLAYTKLDEDEDSDQS